MPILHKELKFNSRRSDERLISSLADAQAMIERVREQGLGRVTGEMTPGIHALAAPIRDHRGHPAAVVAITGAGGAFDSSLRGETASFLRKIAADASLQLGYSAAKPFERPEKSPVPEKKSHSRTAT
jgi:DNA-binding IclR family transcriptional regulator